MAAGTPHTYTFTIQLYDCDVLRRPLLRVSLPCRQLLCNVVRVKMEIFQLSNMRSQQPEEYLRAFLDAEVKPLWPQGWMQTR